MSDAPERIWANPITTDRGALIEGEWYDACGGEYSCRSNTSAPTFTQT